MTMTKKALIAVGALAAGLTLAAGLSMADRGWGEHHGRGHSGEGPRMFEMLDGDEDGRLTRAEVEAFRDNSFAKFDSDRSDTLSLEEYQALWLDFMREHMVDRFQMMDADGNAAVTKEEFIRPLDRMFSWLDRNDDDSISRDDMRGHGHHRYREKYDDDRDD